MKRIIYLDNAATTPLNKEVFLTMKPYWSEDFGNPGSITKIGVKAKQAVEKARENIANSLLRRPAEIIFTSGGTEANNLAIFGVLNDLEKRGINISDSHFITTNIEHSSISECFREIERRGGKVDYLKVDKSGIVNPTDLRKIIKANTVFVSVGYANNEIGTIQPIKEIAKEVRHARKNNPNLLFHTDASQAGLYLNLNINELGVDLLTLDAQKIYGPKGVGILFIKAGTKILPIIFGGGQERGLRSGTENVPLIVGLAKAVEIARKDFAKKAKKIKIIRDYFWQKIQREIPEVILNGSLENRLPSNLNISILNIDSEFTVLCLDEKGIICSTKSACNHDEDGSLVVQALGGTDTNTKSSLRFSLGYDITKKDIDFVVLQLKNIVQKQQDSLPINF
jgi:cysteine desulfurase